MNFSRNGYEKNCQCSTEILPSCASGLFQKYLFYWLHLFKGKLTIYILVIQDIRLISTCKVVDAHIRPTSSLYPMK